MIDAYKASLLQSLTDQREHVLGALESLPDDALRRAVLPSGWTPLGLAYHLAMDVEPFWFLDVIVGDADGIAEGVDDAWHPPAEMSAESILARWARATLPLVAWQSVGLDDSGADVYERPTSDRSLWHDVSLAAGRRKRSLPTKDVQAAADAYRKAMAHGDAPVPAVMKKLRLEPSQRGRAERLISGARETKLLGPTTRGRKGEDPLPH